jgi:hypothetical protein
VTRELTAADYHLKLLRDDKRNMEEGTDGNKLRQSDQSFLHRLYGTLRQVYRGASSQADEGAVKSVSDFRNEKEKEQGSAHSEPRQF